MRRTSCNIRTSQPISRIVWHAYNTKLRSVLFLYHQWLRPTLMSWRPTSRKTRRFHDFVRKYTWRNYTFQLKIQLVSCLTFKTTLFCYIPEEDSLTRNLAWCGALCHCQAEHNLPDLYSRRTQDPQPSDNNKKWEMEHRWVKVEFKHSRLRKTPTIGVKTDNNVLSPKFRCTRKVGTTPPKKAWHKEWESLNIVTIVAQTDLNQHIKTGLAS